MLQIFRVDKGKGLSAGTSRSRTISRHTPSSALP